MSIRQMQTNELPWVNQQYQEIEFKFSGSDDFIAIAEVSGVRAGIGRVVYLTEQQGELGGMYVLPGFRGHSLASEIVKYLISESGCTQLFCIPFTHLRGLYQKLGFQRSVRLPQYQLFRTQLPKNLHGASNAMKIRYL